MIRFFKFSFLYYFTIFQNKPADKSSGIKLSFVEDEEEEEVPSLSSLLLSSLMMNSLLKPRLHLNSIILYWGNCFADAASVSRVE